MHWSLLSVFYALLMEYLACTYLHATSSTCTPGYIIIVQTFSFLVCLGNILYVVHVHALVQPYLSGLTNVV